jgi:taurine dioxygenase
MQTLLLGLKAEHDFLKSFPIPRAYRDVEDPLARWEEGRKNNPPVVHPVVRTHPTNGRKGLFVNSAHTSKILGLHKAESDALLNFLFAHIAKPEFTMRWTWSVNDIAFWDNQITQHYAVNDYLPHRRIMNRATVLGDKPF